MTEPMRFASCLAVIGAALVTLAVRQPPEAPVPASRAASTVAAESAPYGPVMVSAPLARPARATRAHHASSHRPGRHRQPVTQPARHRVVQKPQQPQRTVAHTAHHVAGTAAAVTQHAATQHATRHHRAHVPGPTHWAALNAAIARLLAGKRL